MFYYQINYMFGSLITIGLTLVLGLLIFVRGRGNKIARSYLFFMISTAIWSFGIYMITASPNERSLIFWGRLLHLGAALVPICYFHFVANVINIEHQKKLPIVIGYAFACIFALSHLFSYFTRSASAELGLIYPNPTNLYWLFIVYFVTYPAYAYYISYKRYRHLTELGKRQLKYVSLSGILGFLGGGISYLTLYGVRIPVLSPMALYMVVASNLFIITATYTVQLMEIELIKRRTLVFSLLYGAVVGIFVLLIFFSQQLLSIYFNLNPWIIPIAALFIITISVRPLEDLLAMLTDKALYQRRYDYLLILKNAAKGMTLITNTKKLLTLMAHLISKNIRVTGCAIYLVDKTSGLYKCEVIRGFAGRKIAANIRGDSTFIRWLIEKKQPLDNDMLINWLNGKKLFMRRLVLKKTLDQMKAEMDELGAAVCIPSFLRGEMIGFLVLGTKLSGEHYLAEDFSLLSTLSNNAAIAFENARMYEELKKRVETLKHLYKDEHKLFIDAASAFSFAIDAKDGFTHTHALKVAEYSAVIAKELEKLIPDVKFNQQIYDNLHIAALLHDVGKIGISDKILNKQDSLTGEEEAELKRHAIIGESILQPIKEIGGAFDLIRHHHENFDGTGYPDGLKGKEIPVVSRIIAVANTYDTMISDRPHRKALRRSVAIKEIKDKAGTQFDPIVVEAFIKTLKNSDEVKKN
ncbi:HD domain-containing phosphohydrolase [Candidatus Omnitrophota bacterium]